MTKRRLVQVETMLTSADVLRTKALETAQKYPNAILNDRQNLLIGNESLSNEEKVKSKLPLRRSKKRK